MIPGLEYFALIMMFILIGTVVSRNTYWFAVVALVLSLSAVEMARGWATWWVEPPRDKIVWYVVGGNQAIVSPFDDPHTRRFYQWTYPRSLEDAIEEHGPVVMLEKEKEEEQGNELFDTPEGDYEYIPLETFMVTKPALTQTN